MSDTPHCQAAFINSLSEEGTKAECIHHLQQTWNDLSECRRKLEEAEQRAMLLAGAHDVKAAHERIASLEREIEALQQSRSVMKMAEQKREIEALREEARRYAENADFWRAKHEGR